MHWADVLAKELAERGSRHVLATAITPSGPIHVGNMREVLTTELVYRSVDKLGCDAELIYIGDTYDPLRKVYPFLDAAKYQEHVGKPLCDIPCPDGCHDNYAAHFLEPFLKDLEALGVRPRVLLAHEMYRKGMYLDATKDALEATKEVDEIIARVSGRALPKNWIPFNVQCAGCQRLNGPIPTLYEFPFIEYRCEACGHEGKKDIRVPGEGKLPWRVDWPARWKFLEVTFEAMGKDHAAAGSSWDTGIEISRKVFGYEPPTRTVYEFIQLKSGGAMHSSAGNAISGSEMLRMTPPETLRFLIARYQPGKHIDFDPGMGIIDLVNEYDRWEQACFTGGPQARDDPQFKELDRVIELSQPSGRVPTEAPPAIPYNHLVLLTDLTGGDWQKVKAILLRSEMVDRLTPEDETHLKARVEHARYWLQRFAPAEARTKLAETWTPDLAAQLGENERRFLHALHGRLAAGAASAEAIHNAIHESAKEVGLGGGKAFQAIYVAFLGAKKGPRAGHFLASLDKHFVLRRLQDASHAA
ncbi:MAG: lysyl-tRNA synthetase, class [Thermoplasmata archaeon]|jgi:lysyl-tRNA synthetase class 1|nr:lysyl-tRNA synthetase, class [Thermoplasmata archaeon]